MCIGTKDVGEGGHREHVPRSFKSGGGTSGIVSPNFSSPSYATGNLLSDKIYISLMNLDFINYCLHNFVGTNQTIINFVLALSHLLIDVSVKR